MLYANYVSIYHNYFSKLEKKSAWLVVVEVVMMAVMEFIISVLQENTYF